MRGLLGLCTKMKPCNLISCPDFPKCCPFELRPKPCILYGCPYRLIDIEDLVYANTPHPDVMEADTYLQQVLPKLDILNGERNAEPAK